MAHSPGIDQERPPSVALHEGQPGQFGLHHIAPALPPRHRLGHARAIRIRQGGERARLRDPHRSHDVVDADQADPVDRAPRTHHPPHPPPDHAVLLGHRADRHGEILQPRHARRVDVAAATVQDPLHRGVVQEPDATLLADPRNLFPIRARQHRPRRNRRVHEEDDARALGHLVAEALQVQRPAAAVHDERDEACHPTRQTHPLEHARVGGIGDDHLVARLDEREQRVEEPLGAPGRDDRLRGGVAGDAAQPRDMRRGRGAQVVAPQEGEVAVGVVVAEGGPRRRDGRRGGRDVRVEVFEAQDPGVGPGRARHAVDREAGDAVQAGVGAGVARAAGHPGAGPKPSPRWAADALRAICRCTNATASSTVFAVATSGGRPRARSRSPKRTTGRR